MRLSADDLHTPQRCAAFGRPADVQQFGRAVGLHAPWLPIAPALCDTFLILQIWRKAAVHVEIG